MNNSDLMERSKKKNQAKIVLVLVVAFIVLTYSILTMYRCIMETRAFSQQQTISFSDNARYNLTFSVTNISDKSVFRVVSSQPITHNLIIRDIDVYDEHGKLYPFRQLDLPVGKSNAEAECIFEKDEYHDIFSDNNELTVNNLKIDSPYFSSEKKTNLVLKKNIFIDEAIKLYSTKHWLSALITYIFLAVCLFGVSKTVSRKLQLHWISKKILQTQNAVFVESGYSFLQPEVMSLLLKNAKLIKREWKSLRTFISANNYYIIYLYLNLMLIIKTEDISDASLNELLKRAAERGCKAAAYEYALSLPEKSVEQLKYLEIAAKGKNAVPAAMIRVGDYYCHGYGGVNVDYGEAFNRYRKACKSDSLLGQYKLGECYENGWGCDKDETAAFKQYFVAANKGCIEAQIRVRDCFKTGKCGVKKDSTEAEKWELIAKQSGNDLVEQVQAAKSEIIAQGKDYFKQFNTDAQRSKKVKNKKKANKLDGDWKELSFIIFLCVAVQSAPIIIFILIGLIIAFH